METIQEMLKTVIAWPTAVIVTVVVLRKPIVALVDRLIKSDHGRAKVGPIEIELGDLAEKGRQAVSDLNRLNTLMAESRLLELEITDGKFGPFFTSEQQEKMKRHIEELKQLTENESGK
jgi:hypothetical protein